MLNLPITPEKVAIPAHKTLSLHQEQTRATPTPSFNILVIPADNSSDLQFKSSTIHKFLSDKQEAFVRVSSISSQEAIDLQEILKDLGLKLRLDWYPETQTAEFRMASLLHSMTVMDWLTLVHPDIVNSFRGVACKNQILISGGDSRVYLTDGRFFSPDFSLWVEQQSGDRSVMQPRVVIESMVSERADHGRAKAKSYLTRSKADIHAVLLINFHNRPEKGKEDLHCKVTIEVCTGIKGLNQDKPLRLDICAELTNINFPPEQSYSEVAEAVSEGQDNEPTTTELAGQADQPLSEVHKSQDRKAGQSLSTGSGDSRTGGTPPGFWEDDTMVDMGPSFQLPSSPQTSEPGKKSILHAPDLLETDDLEVRDSFVVYDETPNAELDDVLLLDVYDLVRKCGLEPDKEVSRDERILEISLQPLHDRIKSAIQAERWNLKHAYAGSSSTQPAKRKGKNVEDMGSLKKARKIASGK